MGKNGIVKSIFGVTLSNIITVIAGVAIGILLPKIMSIDDYGWYKTFTLYTTYTGFAHLGLIDGIVLKFGGYNYEQMDKQLFRSYFRWYTILNVFFAVIIVTLSFFFIEDKDYRIVLLLLSGYLIIANYTSYFQLISQITQRFREYSFRKILSSLLKIVSVAVLFVASIVGVLPTYRVYILIFVISELILTVWYIFTYKDIIFGSSFRLEKTWRDVVDLCKNGFPLLFANLCSSLILSLDRQFVRSFFDTTIYAKYSFAYNMLTLVTVATSAISTVLYPTLKRTDIESMRKNYNKLVGIISLIVFGALVVYFPLCIFVRWFLPQYVESLPIFRIVFPGLAMSSSVTVIMHNYYKTEGKNIVYFKKSIIVLIISALANMVAFLYFHSTTAISIASIITMFFWYLYIEQPLVKNYNSSSKKNLFFLIIMTFVFYIISLMENNYLGFAVYLLLYCSVSWLFYKGMIKKDILRKLKK